MESILDFHKTQTRNDGGFLSPPHKQYSTESSSDSEQDERPHPPTPPPTSSQKQTASSATRGGKGRGRRGRRGRGWGARVVGTRRSNRLAKVESSDEDEDSSGNEELDMKPSAVPPSKKRNIARSPVDLSSNGDGTSEEESDSNNDNHRSPKQPKYDNPVAVSMTTASPLSSPRSDVSHDESPDPPPPMAVQKGDGTVTSSKRVIHEHGKPSSPPVVVTNEPHQAPLSVVTPDSTPVHHPQVEEMNYTIAHSTPESVINPSPSSMVNRTVSSNMQAEYNRRSDIHGQSTTMADLQTRREHIQQLRTHPSNAPPTNQPSELTNPQEKSSSINMYPTQGGWPVSHQFMQGGYPYNPKLHPMTAYHAPQGMMPGNYPYPVPYPWPHPPQSSQHLTPEQQQQMRVGSFPQSVSTPPTYPTGTQSIGGVAGEGTWTQQQQQQVMQKRKKESSGVGGAKKSASVVTTPSTSSTSGTTAYQQQQKNVGVASLHQQHIDHSTGSHHHGSGGGRVITSSPNMQQYYHQSQPPQQMEPPTAAAATPFQYGFDSRHAHFSPAAAHMWQSSHSQHPATAQLHPLMSHHLAQQGLWYAQQNPQQVGMATMPHPPGGGGVDNRTIDKGRKGPG